LGWKAATWTQREVDLRNACLQEGTMPLGGEEEEKERAKNELCSNEEKQGE
jgi:hypothetical protein